MNNTKPKTMKNIESKAYFSCRLLEWFRSCQRDLPWRRTKNPYHIWVSEIMLQQTRVETVIPYFYKFIEKFPTIDALSAAPEEEVLKAWEGLGYYSRARNLQAAVREVREQYGGVVPDDKADISKLKGVGPYTAGAILSIAYNKPEPAVDGNVMRVLSRYFLIEDDIAKISTRTQMERLICEIMPQDAAGDFNQGLMELGALVCTPKSPHCLTCPVLEHCAGRLAGMEEALPVKKKAKPPRVENRVVALIEGSGDNAGRFLIRQRPQEGLLARMWELPHFEAPAEASAVLCRCGPVSQTGAEPERQPFFADFAAAAGISSDSSPEPSGRDAPCSPKHASPGMADLLYLQNRLAKEAGINAAQGDWFMNAEHTFSHIHWDMRVYVFKTATPIYAVESPSSNQAFLHHSAPVGGQQGNYRWISADEMEKYAFPNVFLRIIKAYVESAWVYVE